MKKEYKKPIVINHNQDVNVWPAVAALAGYAAARAVTKAMDVQPVIKEKDLKCLK